MLIKKIAINKSSGQKIIYIDKNSDFEVGDYVIISKINEKKVIENGRQSN